MLLKWANRWGSRSNTFKDIFYIINFGIYRWYQAVIPIFDIWIGFGVMAEKLNHYVGIFRFCWCFFVHPAPPPPPPDKNSKFQERLSSNVLDFRGFVNICLKWVGQILISLAVKRRNRTKIQGSALCSAIPISWCFLRKRSILWAGQTKFPGPDWHASPTLNIFQPTAVWGPAYAFLFHYNCLCDDIVQTLHVKLLFRYRGAEEFTGRRQKK